MREARSSSRGKFNPVVTAFSRCFHAVFTVFRRLIEEQALQLQQQQRQQQRRQPPQEFSQDDAPSNLGMSAGRMSVTKLNLEGSGDGWHAPMDALDEWAADHEWTDTPSAIASPDAFRSRQPSLLLQAVQECALGSTGGLRGSSALVGGYREPQRSVTPCSGTGKPAPLCPRRYDARFDLDSRIGSLKEQASLRAVNKAVYQSSNSAQEPAAGAGGGSSRMPAQLAHKPGNGALRSLMDELSSLRSPPGK